MRLALVRVAASQSGETRLDERVVARRTHFRHPLLCSRSVSCGDLEELDR